MKKILFSWIGRTDLRAVNESKDIGIGPIAQAIESTEYDHIILLSDYSKIEASQFVDWLRLRKDLDISVRPMKLTSPTNFGEIYKSAVDTITAALKQYSDGVSLTYHLSPGTPAMAAIWILLAKTRFPARLIESSKEKGVQPVDIPFDISAEFIPSFLQETDSRLEKLSFGLPPESPEFDSIIHRSTAMKRVIAKARRVAPRSVSVLIEGESGTGKELLARAIHQASPRHNQPFVAVNCGAIPPDLVESEFFGYVKGAFTGALQDRKGYFESADKGTLFLDEIGELAPPAQVKILRVLQEGEVVRIGKIQPIKIDVRIIAATNRSLINELAANRFRADLFYRLAVAVLQLPPLRDREGDLSLLIVHLLEQINIESSREPGYIHKKISSAARNLMLSYSWPGNVRELLNTLRRAAVWSSGSRLTEEDIRDAMLPVPRESRGMGHETAIPEGFNLSEVISEMAGHYLTLAMQTSNGNKTLAAKMLGLPSYQTLSNWLVKYGVVD